MSQRYSEMFKGITQITDANFKIVAFKQYLQARNEEYSKVVDIINQTASRTEDETITGFNNWFYEECDRQGINPLAAIPAEQGYIEFYQLCLGVWQEAQDPDIVTKPINLKTTSNEIVTSDTLTVVDGIINQLASSSAVVAAFTAVISSEDPADRLTMFNETAKDLFGDIDASVGAVAFLKDKLSAGTTPQGLFDAYKALTNNDILADSDTTGVSTTVGACDFSEYCGASPAGPLNFDNAKNAVETVVNVGSKIVKNLFKTGVSWLKKKTQKWTKQIVQIVKDPDDLEMLNTDIINDRTVSNFCWNQSFTAPQRSVYDFQDGGPSDPTGTTNTPGCIILNWNDIDENCRFIKVDGENFPPPDSVNGKETYIRFRKAFNDKGVNRKLIFKLFFGTLIVELDDNLSSWDELIAHGIGVAGVDSGNLAISLIKPGSDLKINWYPSTFNYNEFMRILTAHGTVSNGRFNCTGYQLRDILTECEDNKTLLEVLNQSEVDELRSMCMSNDLMKWSLDNFLTAYVDGYNTGIRSLDLYQSVTDASNKDFLLQSSGYHPDGSREALMGDTTGYGIMCFVNAWLLYQYERFIYPLDFGFYPYSNSDNDMPVPGYRIRTDSENRAAFNNFATTVVIAIAVVAAAVTVGVAARKISLKRAWKREQTIATTQAKMWNGEKLTPAEMKKYRKSVKKGGIAGLFEQKMSSSESPSDSPSTYELVVQETDHLKRLISII